MCMAIALLPIGAQSAPRRGSGQADAIDAPRITQQAFKKLVAANNVVIVDTRTQKEYDNEHVRGAILAPYVEKSLKEIDFDASKDDFSALKTIAKDKPAVFICNGPECWKSYKATRAAVAAGYTKVYWFRGGMPEWREKHLPVDGSAGAALANIPAPRKAGGEAVVAAKG